MANNNKIDYFTITSTGNASDFGDMLNGQPGSTGNRYPACTSNGTNERGLSCGGGDSGSNMIQYITMNSLGNAQDFGDLSAGSWAQAAACSDSHGGLGGF